MTFPKNLDTESMSSACSVAYEHDVPALHATCKRTKDIPTPTAPDIVLIRRCTCPCHSAGGAR